MPARVIALLIAGAAVLAAGACDRNGGDDSRTRINVLDSAFTQSWQTMQDTGVVYRIEVISPLGVDTIRNVIPPAPVVIGDTLVIGLIQVSEDSSTPQRQIFRARLGQHRIETKPMPADVWASYQDVLVSPHGRYIAYVGADTTPENPGTYAVVRNLTNNEIVAKGPGGGGCAGAEDF